MFGPDTCGSPCYGQVPNTVCTLVFTLDGKLPEVVNNSVGVNPFLSISWISIPHVWHTRFHTRVQSTGPLLGVNLEHQETDRWNRTGVSCHRLDHLESTPTRLKTCGTPLWSGTESHTRFLSFSHSIPLHGTPRRTWNVRRWCGPHHSRTPTYKHKPGGDRTGRDEEKEGKRWV